MPSVQPRPFAVAALTFLLAGFVKGVIRLGLPTVSMGLLSLVMAPAEAASLLIVPSFVTNVFQLAAGPSFMRLAYRLWPMLKGVVLGTLAGIGLLTGSHAGQAAVALMLMLYAALGLTSVRFAAPPSAEWWLGPLIGARPRSSDWRLAEACAAGSASRPSVGSSSAGCSCSALTSRRRRCSDEIAALDAPSLTIRPRHNTTAHFAQPYGPLRYSRKQLSS